jgi:phosphoribosylformylglycinamidine synthase
MKSAVVVFPGSNRERDAIDALRRCTGTPPHLVWHKDSDLPPVDLIVLPGGFTYGDYLRCGAIAAHSPVMREVRRRAEQGVAVMGICNGFQMLIEAGLLPGALLRNRSLRFVCREVGLEVERTDTAFTHRYRAGQRVSFPVAHGDGNYFVDDDGRRRLEDEGLIVFRYCDAKGQATPEANPNGSVANIAGITNDRGNVLGLMPHPENGTDPALGGTDGRALFEGLAEALG